MKKKEFKTSKGVFAVVDLPLDVTSVSKGGLVRFEDDVEYTPIFNYEVESIARFKDTTEEQASGILGDMKFHNYGDYLPTNKLKLEALIKSLGIYLYENPAPMLHHKRLELEQNTFYNPYIFKLSDNG